MRQLFWPLNTYSLLNLRVLHCRLWFISSAASVPTPLPPSMFKQCNSLPEAKLIHQQVIKVHGLISQHSFDVIPMYISCGASSHALAFLQRLPPSSVSVYWWNALIRCYVNDFLLENVLETFNCMRRLGLSPDCYTYPFVLKACREIPSFWLGASVHCASIVVGLDSNVFVCNAVVSMYGRCGDLDYACRMFDKMLEKEVCDRISWNSIVAAHVECAEPRSALKQFEKMNHAGHGACPDAVSLVNVLPACVALQGSMWGRQVHAAAVRRGLFVNVFVGNALIDFYAKIGMMDQARKVFRSMKEKDLVSWNALISGYSQLGLFEDTLRLFEEIRNEKIELNIVTWTAIIAGYVRRDRGYEALDTFRQMRLSGLEPNVVTLVSLLSACSCVGALIQGKEAHCYAIKRILTIVEDRTEHDIRVINSLIDMYAKCEKFEYARSLFDSVPKEHRNVVTWTAMIHGYMQHGDAHESLKLFSQMMQPDISASPSAFTMSSVLMACVQLTALRSGKQIHACVLRYCFESDVLFISNCLIDMYSKCGKIDAARKVFDCMNERNFVSWTTLLTGYGLHGRGEDAIRTFEEMKEAGLAPDSVTFLIILSACSHSGMVDHGMNYFQSMTKEFSVVPTVEHFACMVDLLGRAGRLKEAVELIESMQIAPSSIVWSALLGACRIKRNVELAEFSVRKLLELGTANDGTYTLLSNVYGSTSHWKDVARIRSQMKHDGFKKRPGCSWVEGKKGAEAFYAGD